MKTKAIRFYGKEDLRLEEFELPEIKENEIRIKVICDSICMSTHKAVKLGTEHWLVNDDIAERPSIIGHEFAGIIDMVGSKWEKDYKVGDSFTIQTALKDLEHGIAGCSMEYCGGDATYIIIPEVYIENNNLLKFNKDLGFYRASLAEPMSCNVAAINAFYHTKSDNSHVMGIKEKGNMAMLASCGPMGLAGISYVLNGKKRPKNLVITDINEEKLNRARKIFTKEYGRARGVELHFALADETYDCCMQITDNKGLDDIIIYAPVQAVIELADSLICKDGCINFFSGPLDKNLKANINFYNVHYNKVHFVGTSGGTTNNMQEFLDMSSRGDIDPAFMITHIGGLEAVIDTVYQLPTIPGGKKLIYPHIDLPLTSLLDLEQLAAENPLFDALAKSVNSHNGMWNQEAEAILLKHFNVNI